MNRLSDLPESVLLRILSFLPARDAARTCLLRTFGDLWTHIDTLVFDDAHILEENAITDYFRGSQPIPEQTFVRFVRSFLLLHKRSNIREFRLKFTHPLEFLAELWGGKSYENDKRNLENEVEIWIKLALDRGVEVLDIGLGVYDVVGNCDFKLPHSVWISNILVELSLFNCVIKLPRQVRMNSLKVLKLNQVTLSKEDLTNIVSNCHMLGEVTIIDCFELEEISFSTPNIETLQVNAGYLDSDLIISCPHVRCFHFSGYVTNLRLVDLSSLKIASFNLKIDRYQHFIEFHKVKRLFEKIHHAEVVRLNKEAFAVPTYRVVKNHPFPCNKWKSVKLDTWLNDKYISGIRSLLRYSTHLEELTLEIKDTQCDLPTDVVCELDDAEYVGVNNENSEWLIHDVKRVTMRGLFKSSIRAQVDLIKVILKNAPNLDKFRIFAKGYAQPSEEEALTFEELFDVSKKLLTFPRACRQAKVFLE